MLQYYNNISLYGNENWKLVDKFKSHYKGYLRTTQEMNQAYNEHTYLLHDTSLLHFRVFDAMSAGLITLKADDSGYGSKDEFHLLDFKEEMDIFTYSLNDFKQTAEKVKSVSVKYIEDVQYSIRDKIIASNTWKSMAQKILDDVDMIEKV